MHLDKKEGTIKVPQYTILDKNVDLRTRKK